MLKFPTTTGLIFDKNERWISICSPSIHKIDGLTSDCFDEKQDALDLPRKLSASLAMNIRALPVSFLCSLIVGLFTT